MTTRSRVVLEMAAELVAMPGQPLRQAKVLLRQQVGVDEWPVALFGSATIEGVHAVTGGDAALAMINPSAALTLAYRGAPPFTAPQPVRTLAVIPSHDQALFVVHPDTGLTSVEDIAAQRFPLRVRTRGSRDHSLAFMLGDVMAAAGFSLNDLRSWGGDVIVAGEFPQENGPEVRSVLHRDVDAIFEEGLDEWLGAAVDGGLVPLGLGNDALERLEAMGYRRALVEQRLYPNLTGDVATVDFSGWPIFVHADAPDALVRQFCAALDARKHLIPWQGEGPLPVERMCIDAPATPIDVPLHPAAAAFWVECGYLAPL